MWPVTYKRKVRYSDTDAQGIVFGANYFVYFDDALTDLFELAGLTMDEMHEHGYDVVNAHAAADFRLAARLGDELVTGIRLQRIGSTSITFEINIWNSGEGTVVCEDTVVQVLVDPVTLKPRPVSDHFADRMQAIHSDPIPR